MEIIKLLPSYIGSKKYWIPHLQHYKNEDFVELFCGSSVISLNLARTVILNDIDPFLYKIISNFNELIVPDIFTQEDYFKYRKQINWWQYAYCLMKISFSGTFRYSKNGFNVPSKKHIKAVYLKPEYEIAKERYNALKPEIYCLNYYDVPTAKLKDKVVVLDPPYEKSQASYNKEFDYHFYWEYVRLLEGWAKTIILFDSVKNLAFSEFKTRKMRVNGKYAGDIEGMYEFKTSLMSGDTGEKIFEQLMKNNLKKLDGTGADFITSTNEYLELKI